MAKPRRGAKLHRNRTDTKTQSVSEKSELAQRAERLRQGAIEMGLDGSWAQAVARNYVAAYKSVHKH
jgi:hypothetical protein